MIPQKKQLSRFRRGRVSVQREVRKQLRIRNNLERAFVRRLTSLFGRFINTKAYLYRELLIITGLRLNYEQSQYKVVIHKPHSLSQEIFE